MSANYVNIAGGTTYTLVVDPASLTLQNNQFRLICKTGDGAITINLPAISEFGNGIDSKIFIEDADDMSSTNNITVVCDPSNTIANGANVIINENGKKIEIYISSHTEFGVISGDSGGVQGSSTPVYLASAPNSVYDILKQIVDEGTGRIYQLDGGFDGAEVTPIVELISYLELTEIVSESFDIKNFPLLTTINFPKLAVWSPMYLASENEISNNPLLTSIYVPKLKVAQTLVFYELDALLEINLPSLTDSCLFSVVLCPQITTLTLPLLKNSVGAIFVETNDLLQTINIPVVESIAEIISIRENAVLTSIGIPSLSAINNIYIILNPLLTTITVSESLACDYVDVTDNALTAQTQTDLLAALIAGALPNGTFVSSGGTSAPLNAQGLIYKSTLESNGWTITTN